jgi:hypothetical protein
VSSQVRAAAAVQASYSLHNSCLCKGVLLSAVSLNCCYALLPLHLAFTLFH